MYAINDATKGSLTDQGEQDEMGNRLSLLIELAREMNVTLDAIHILTQDLDVHSLRKAKGKVSALPKYKKSRLKP